MEASRRKPAGDMLEVEANGKQPVGGSRKSTFLKWSRLLAQTEVLNLQTSPSLKLSNFQTLKLSNCQTFKSSEFRAVFKLSNFCMLDGSWFMAQRSWLMAGAGPATGILSGNLLASFRFFGVRRY